MKMKKAFLRGIAGNVLINNDGTQITYNGEPVNQYLVKSETHSKGFHQVSIEGVKIYTHKLVAEAWVTNPRPLVYKMVLHNDCNSTHNYYKNLSWGDRTILYQNLKANGVASAIDAKNLKQRGSSKIPYKEAIKIARRLDKGEYASDICKEYGVSEMSINRIRKRYCEKKQASKRYSIEVKQVCYQLLVKYPLKEVSKITGVGYETLWRWRKNIVT